MEPARGAVDLLEESVGLLRDAPARTIAIYLAGAVPFTLALLYFLADMTHNPFAMERLAAESLGVAAMFVWKSFCQALFMRRLHDQLSPALAPFQPVRVFAIQCSIQPLGLIAIPIGLLITIPFAGIAAFFRNVALFAALGDAGPVRAARKQAALWTRQNWGALAIVALAGSLLFANVLLLLFLLPQLARTFLGIEGDLVRLGVGILNLTTTAVAAAVTWMAVDPLLDAFYTLRCFHGASLSTGEDLLAAIRRAAITATVFAGLVFFLCGIAPRVALAQAPPSAVPASAADRALLARVPAIDPPSLGRSIDQVIRRREFTWRAPRPQGEESQELRPSWLRSLREMLRGLGKELGNFWEGLMKLLRGEAPPEGPEGRTDAAATRRILEVFLAVAAFLAIAAAGLFVRAQRRKRGPVSARAASASPAVNLADESLSADQLPEESWRRLAEEWLAKGDCRLALRALYLAGLNYLGERDLISIRRWKSGLEYSRELERRARARAAVGPEIAPVFARNVALFERGWYGLHAVDRSMVEDFAAGLDRIRDEIGNHAERV